MIILLWMALSFILVSIAGGLLGNLAVFGVMPNIILIVLIAIVWLKKDKSIFWMALFCGVFADLLSNHIFGIETLSLLVAVLLVFIYIYLFNTYSFSVFIGVIMLGIFFYDLSQIFFNFLFNYLGALNINYFWLNLSANYKLILWEGLYTLILSLLAGAIVFWIQDKYV